MNKNKIKKIIALFSVLAIIGCTCVMFAFADADPGTAIKDTMNLFISYIVDAFRCVGILIGVYAIAQFALAFKDDNADAKQRSTIMLVVAVLLIMCKTLVKKIISLSGVNGLPLDKGFLGD